MPSGETHPPDGSFNLMLSHLHHKSRQEALEQRKYGYKYENCHAGNKTADTPSTDSIRKRNLKEPADCPESGVVRQLKADTACTDSNCTQNRGYTAGCNCAGHDRCCCHKRYGCGALCTADDLCDQETQYQNRNAEL